MNDLEKVIRGMESLKTRLIDCGDGLDGAVVANAIAMLKAQDAELERLKNCRAECKIECLLDEYNKVVSERDSLLKAQEPVEPIFDYDGRDVWRCGNCHRNIFHPTRTDEDENEKNYRRFCFHCGRAVKWDE